MTHQSPATVTVTSPPPAGRLEPDAIGVAQDTVIGMASAAPAVCVALTLAPIAAATAYGERAGHRLDRNSDAHHC